MGAPPTHDVSGRTEGTPAGFVTVRIPVFGAHGMPLVFTLPLIQVVIAPPSLELQGWKAIANFSRQHNGPTSAGQLRRLAQAGQCPIHGFGADGTVVADEQEFLRWLRNRRVHLAYRPLNKRRRPKPAKRAKLKPAPSR